MFKFIKNLGPGNTENKKSNELLLKTASLLIHAAKIDENFTDKERKIIEAAILNLGADRAEVKKIVAEAEHLESNSNQILDFTREIKNKDNKFKIEIIETLWNIIYSNNEADIYESNLMRRLSGLLYIDNKIMGDIKDKIKKKFE
tara:strand:- start:127 stop:561 length:435 start_codon:yes stop_codon:yes gene_type:complete